MLRPILYFMFIRRCKGRDISGKEVDLKVLRGDSDSSQSLEGGKSSPRVLNVKHMEEGAEEQLELHLCYLVPQTHPLTGSEGHEVSWLVETA